MRIWIAGVGFLLVCCGEVQPPLGGSAGAGGGGSAGSLAPDGSTPSAAPDAGQAGAPTAFLAPPPPERGFQVEPASFPVEPGQEAYHCYTLPLPDRAFELQRVESRFAVGAHHLLVSTVDRAFPEGHGPCTASDFGWNVSLGDAFSSNLRFLSGAQTPYADDPRADLTLEPGLAFSVRAGSTLLLQLHWANTTTQTQSARTAVNLWYPTEAPNRPVEAFFFYHSAIDIPAHGSADVAGRCVFPRPLEIVGMVSHMHARGTHFSTRLYDGQLGALIYDEDSWQEPKMKMWPQAGLLRASGLEYRCHFENTTDAPIRDGDSARDEMCMLIGLQVGGPGTLWGFPGMPFLGNTCTAVP